jgi:hypothetical protein
MPRYDGVMVYAKDGTLKGTKSFTAQIQTLDNIPGELKVGHSPIGLVRCGCAACRISMIDWKTGEETGGAKTESLATRRRISRPTVEQVAQAQYQAGMGLGPSSIIMLVLLLLL